MDIDRKIRQCGIENTIHRVKFCLDEIEKLEFNVSDFFKKKWGSRITYEEIIGALVSAEQTLQEVQNR